MNPKPHEYDRAPNAQRLESWCVHQSVRNGLRGERAFWQARANLQDGVGYTYEVRAVKAASGGGGGLESAEAANTTLSYQASAAPAVKVTYLTEAIDPFCLIEPGEPDEDPLPPVMQVRLEAQRVVDRVEVVFTGDGGRELGTHEVSVPPVGGPVDVFWPPTGHPCPGELPEWADVLSGEQINVTLYVYFKFDPSEIVVVNGRARLARRQVGQVVRSYVLQPVGGSGRGGSFICGDNPISGELCENKITEPAKVCIGECDPGIIIDEPVLRDALFAYEEGQTVAIRIRYPVKRGYWIGRSAPFYPYDGTIPTPQTTEYFEITDSKSAVYNSQYRVYTDEAKTRRGANFIFLKYVWYTQGGIKRVYYQKIYWEGSPETWVTKDVRWILNELTLRWMKWDTSRRECATGVFMQELDGELGAELVNYLETRAFPPSEQIANQKENAGFIYTKMSVKCEELAFIFDTFSAVGGVTAIKQILKQGVKKAVKKAATKELKKLLKRLLENKAGKLVLTSAEHKMLAEQLEDIFKESFGKSLQKHRKDILEKGIPEYLGQFFKEYSGRLPLEVKKVLAKNMVKTAEKNPDDLARTLFNGQHDEVVDAFTEVMKYPPPGMEDEVAEAFFKARDVFIHCLTPGGRAASADACDGVGETIWEGRSHSARG